jgi:hypothetical protein
MIHKNIYEWEVARQPVGRRNLARVLQDVYGVFPESVEQCVLVYSYSHGRIQMVTPVCLYTKKQMCAI